MKEGWKQYRLGDCCEIYQPQTIASNKLIPNGQFLVYGANGVIGRYSEYNHQDSEVLLCCRGATCGAINVSKPFSWINGNAMVVKPNPAIMQKNFLRYLLASLDYGHIITGAAQPQITRKSLAPTNFFCPPLSEQQSIVTYLDTSFSLIDSLAENAKKALENAKALFQAELKKLMEKKEGWEEKKLGDLCKDIRYGTSIPSNENGDYKYLRMNNVTNDGFLDISHYKTISLPEKELEKCLVKKGDIIFNRTNSPELVGKSCVFTSDEPMVIAGYLIRIRLIEGLNPQFITYYMNRQRVIGNMRPFIVGAVHQANISAKNIQKLVINFPSIEEQQKIVQTLDTLSQYISQLEQNYNKTLNNCQALKQALLRKTFE